MLNNNQNISLPDQIALYRGRRGFTQQDLADKLSVSKQTISNWETGLKNPRMGAIQKMAELFGITVSELIDGSQEQNFPFEMVNIKLYGTISAGVLSEVEGIDSDNVKIISLPLAMFSRPYNSNKLFAMKVNGSSMDKVIQHDEVIIAKQDEFENYKDGDIVIFSHDNEYSLKRYCPNEVEGAVLFKAESHDPAFKDIVVMSDTDYNVKIHGKVIYYGTTL